jgi:hypothetical protein
MVARLIFLVEDASMEAFLRALLPRLMPQGCQFEINAFQGKPDLFKQLEKRLRGYARRLEKNERIVVLVDLDQCNCSALKTKLEVIARRAGLRTRTQASGAQWQLVNRIAVEELEAWYFGDWAAVRGAYPNARLPRQLGSCNPDAIQGGTWETFERVMKKSGYFKNGLRKTEAAKTIGEHIDAARSTSRSFRCFVQAVQEACRQATIRPGAGGRARRPTIVLMKAPCSANLSTSKPSSGAPPTRCAAAWTRLNTSTLCWA